MTKTKKEVAWPFLQQELSALRPRLLADAVADTKKWCPPSVAFVRGKTRSDQYWLELFSAGVQVSGPDVHSFLVTYNLARWTTWDTESIAARILPLRRTVADEAEVVRSLAGELTADIRSGQLGRQTSAASKLAFFALPHRSFFIWDQFAIRSARYRDWVRDGATAKPRPFERVFGTGRNQDYAAFRHSCAAAFEEEMRVQDFRSAIGHLREYFAMSAGKAPTPSLLSQNGFLERRFLDKLMFWEGQALAGIRAAAA